MRVLLLGVATVALSGCSWFSGGYGHNMYGNNGQNQGYYGSKPASNCCVGGKSLSRWNLEGGLGTDFLVGGDAISGDKTNVINGVTANTLSMNDVYDNGMRYELGTSYAINPNRKITVMGSYANAEGQNFNLGTIDGDIAAGKLSDYERWGIEAGLRQYFQPTPAPLVHSVRPYVEGRLGAANIKDIDLENATLGTDDFLTGDVPFYKGGWVPTAAGLIGVETPVFEHATLGLETGIRYTGTPKTDTSLLSPGVSLAGSNNAGSSWSVPLTLRGRYRF